MRKILWMFCLSSLLLQAESAQQTIDNQALEIKELKRQLAIKKQEIKILLITLKNAQQEAMLSSSSQALQFNDVKTPSRATVVLKPSMLSESAIREINKYDQIDTDAIQENLRVSLAEKAKKAALKKRQEAPKKVTLKPKPASPKPVMKKPLAKKIEVKKPEAKKPLHPKPVVAKKREKKDEEKAKKAEIKKVPKPTLAVITDTKPSVKLPPLEYTKPLKYRLKKAAKVYTEIGSDHYKMWKARRAFTSNKKRGSWIQITGQITHEGWIPSPKTLWISEKDVSIIY